MNSATNRVFSQEEKAKLDMLFRDGITTFQEIEDLTEGLNDTIKAIAEEMQIKPSVLKKAVKTAHKNDFGNKSEDHEMMETLLATVNKI